MQESPKELDGGCVPHYGTVTAFYALRNIDIKKYIHQLTLTLSAWVMLPISLLRNHDDAIRGQPADPQSVLNSEADAPQNFYVIASSSLA